MKFLVSYFKPYKNLLILTLVLATINQVFSMLDPQIFRMIVDKYLTNIDQRQGKTHEFIMGVGLLLLGLMWVAMVSRIAKNFQEYYVSVMTQKIGMRMYQHSIHHAFSLPYKVFEDQQSGQILQKLLKARQDIQTFIESMIGTVFLSLVTMVFVIIYAFWVHRLVGTLYLALIPLMGWMMYAMSKRIKKAQADIVRESAEAAGATVETVRNVALIKTLWLENQEYNRLQSANEKILSLELIKTKLIRWMSFSQGTVINAMRLLLQASMFWLVYQGLMTLGEFFSLFFYSFYVFGPLWMFGTVVKQYQEAKASHENLQTLLSIPPEKLPTNPKIVWSINSITFSNVWFSYESGGEVLNDISVSMKAGQTVAFVGPSGSGKSTILKLLCGLYPAWSGEIAINNTSMSELDMHAMRLRLGVVSQDAQLFSGTIKQNLLFVQPHATDEDCRKVLQQAAIADFVRGSSDGLDTKIGENGLKLSGGQKQRLAIARALLRDPDVLIFDEATSSLDSIVEKEISQTIAHVSSHQTDLITILVAHRLSTVIHADVIYVLEKGKIIELGKHSELVQKWWLYAALWREQSGE